ncbi:hypothetical protein EV356DRAFT_281612 [Viridothelium virens]|uniref:Uncharacterized protein n=1 Tax=Viridothelium virens TaxID=1048519 RepID=A0A6A6H1E4_VIRVR|nr:hypothetical protein EV356DRAFT_281612 [Viridothelium virens]
MIALPPSITGVRIRYMEGIVSPRTSFPQSAHGLRQIHNEAEHSIYMEYRIFEAFVSATIFKAVIVLKQITFLACLTLPLSSYFAFMRSGLEDEEAFGASIMQFSGLMILLLEYSPLPRPLTLLIRAIIHVATWVLLCVVSAITLGHLVFRGRAMARRMIRRRNNAMPCAVGLMRALMI